MSAHDGSLVIPWADGEYRFRLPIGQLRELQEKCKAGPPEVFFRLQANVWRVDDIRETIRLGLIGGGMQPTQALSLVTRYVDARPLMENYEPAMQIIGTALLGAVDDQPRGKGAPEESLDGSASPNFTPPGPSSGGAPVKSMN
jgi:hypothetical protein